MAAEEYKEILKRWGLGDYTDKFDTEGWDDPKYWGQLIANDGAILDKDCIITKKGHRAKFIANYKKEFMAVKEHRPAHFPIIYNYVSKKETSPPASSILTTKELNDDFKIVLNRCKFDDERDSLKLIFASRIYGNDKVEENFHKLCDQRGECIVIAQTTNNHICGGYTRIGFGSDNKYHYDGEAFLFVLKEYLYCGQKSDNTMPRIFELKGCEVTKKEGNIWWSSKYGPQFDRGGGFTINNIGINHNTSYSGNPCYDYDVPSAKELTGGFNHTWEKYEVYKIDRK